MNPTKNETIAFSISFFVHCLFFLIFTLYIAWTPPDPPIEQYGMEIALDTEGSTEATPSSQTEPENEEITNPHEEATPTHSPETTIPDEPSEISKNDNSEIPIQNNIKKTKDISEETKENTKPSHTDENKKKVKEITPEKKQPVIDERGIYGNDKKTTSKKGSPNGSSLEITGWIWDTLPKPEEKSHESGRIIFEIKIDSDGYIISVKTLESNVSPEVEKIYKEEVEKLTFSPTSPESLKNKESIGKITFIITAK